MIRVSYKTSVADGSTATPTFSMPVFGGNPLLVVAFTARAGGLSADIQWNGQTFTEAVSVTDSYTYGELSSIYYLVPAAPGTYDLTIPMGSTSFKAQAFLLNDVNQSSPIDDTGSDTRTASGSQLSPAVTTTQANSLAIQVHGGIVSNSGAAALNGINLNSGQTLLGERYSGPSGNCAWFAYKLISSATTDNLSAQFHLNGNTAVSQEDIAAVACAFKQSLNPQGAFILDFAN